MSSPAMSPDPRRSALILSHPSAFVRVIDPVTGETVDNAKRAAHKERVAYEATRRAGIDGVDLRFAPSVIRAAYLDRAAMFLEPLKGLSL